MPTSKILTRDQLIQAGVQNLKEFGYPEVNKNNILIDMIYKEFFKRMLQETYEQSPNQVACRSLLEEIDGSVTRK